MAAHTLEIEAGGGGHGAFRHDHGMHPIALPRCRDGRYPVFAEIVDGEMGERVIALHIHLDFMYCFADDKRAKKDIAKQEAEYLAMMNATEAKEHTEHDTVNP